MQAPSPLCLPQYSQEQEPLWQPMPFPFVNLPFAPPLSGSGRQPILAPARTVVVLEALVILNQAVIVGLQWL